MAVFEVDRHPGATDKAKIEAAHAAAVAHRAAHHLVPQTVLFSNRLYDIDGPLHLNGCAQLASEGIGLSTRLLFRNLATDDVALKIVGQGLGFGARGFEMKFAALPNADNVTAVHLDGPQEACFTDFSIDMDPLGKDRTGLEVVRSGTHGPTQNLWFDRWRIGNATRCVNARASDNTHYDRFYCNTEPSTADQLKSVAIHCGNGAHNVFSRWSVQKVAHLFWFEKTLTAVESRAHQIALRNIRVEQGFAPATGTPLDPENAQIYATIVRDQAAPTYNAGECFLIDNVRMSIDSACFYLSGWDNFELIGAAVDQASVNYIRPATGSQLPRMMRYTKDDLDALEARLAALEAGP